MNYIHTVRRRRLLSLLLLAAFILLSTAFNGWRLTPLWAVLDNDQGTYVAGDPAGEWIYAVCDGEQQQITVMREGASRRRGGSGLPAPGVPIGVICPPSTMPTSPTGRRAWTNCTGSHGKGLPPPDSGYRPGDAGK